LSLFLSSSKAGYSFMMKLLYMSAFLKYSVDSANHSKIILSE